MVGNDGIEVVGFVMVVEVMGVMTCKVNKAGYTGTFVADMWAGVENPKQRFGNVESDKWMETEVVVIEVVIEVVSSVAFEATMGDNDS